ncbi:M48 family metallopeptidase [Arthrobacter sp. Sr33]
MTVMMLTLDGMQVPVEQTAPGRRAKLTIERDGSLCLQAAADVAVEELQKFLVEKRDWIYRKLAEKELLTHDPVNKELVDGEGFLYLGRSYRLQIQDDATGKVSLQRGRLVLPSRLKSGGEVQLINWYIERGTRWLKPRAKEWAERLRVDPSAIEVADLGYKWGAATPGGRVRVHWATMQLRPALVEYVLAHELAHLREPHHGPAFWELLTRVMPDQEARRKELAVIGATAWLNNVCDRKDADVLTQGSLKEEKW